VSYGTNDVAYTANGQAPQTDTVAALPSLMAELRIGYEATGSKVLNGHVKRIALYSEALTDTNLQALTS